MRADLNDLYKKETEERIKSSPTVNAMIGTFFTVMAGYMAYRGSYLLIACLLLFALIGIWREYKNGELSVYDILGTFYILFFSIPVVVYMMHILIKSGCYWYPVMIGLMAVPGIFELLVKFFNDIKGD